MIKKYLSSLFSDWSDQSIRTVEQFLEKGGKMIDLGCGDGDLTVRFAKSVKPTYLIGIDAFSSKKKFRIVKGNLNRKLHFPNNSFDVVVSNYSIEHLYNTGMFISETHRILKKGGYTVVATDNLSSWTNVLSLIMGYQPTTLTQGIAQRAIGNPFALRSNNEILDSKFALQWRLAGEYSHNKALAYQALIEAYTEYGFVIEKITGAGYFPFKGFLSRIMERVDVRHSHLLILKARKT